MPSSSGLSQTGLAVIVCAGLSASLWLLVSRARLSAKPGALKLTGAGMVNSPPDSGKVTFTATGKAATAGEAREKAATTAAQTVEALLTVNGVGKKDLTTDSFNVNEHMEWDGKEQKNVHLGYKAENGFSLTVHDVSEERLAEVIDVAVNAGQDALSISRVSLFLSPKLRRKLTNDARRLALDDARDSARMYAQELGATVGPLNHFADRTVAHSTEDYQSGAPVARFAARSSAAKMEMAATPVSLGQQSVSVTVDLECVLYSNAAAWLHLKR